MTEQMGYKSRMSIGGNLVEFITHDIVETIERVEDEGIRGTRSHSYERINQGNIAVGGSITFEPTPAEFVFLLPLVLGNSTSALLLTDALLDVTILIDNLTATQTFVGRFSAMHISGEPGKRIQLKMDFVGKTCVMTAGGSLSGFPDISTVPYMFYGGGSGITIAGTAYNIDKFELTVDNKIVPTYMMGQTATDLEPTDREVLLSIDTKYTTVEAALLTTALLGPILGSPNAASIAFTNGTQTMAFTFSDIEAIPKTVPIPNKNHLRLGLDYRAYRVGSTSTLEMVTTLS